MMGISVLSAANLVMLYIRLFSRTSTCATSYLQTSEPKNVLAMKRLCAHGKPEMAIGALRVSTQLAHAPSVIVQPSRI